MESLAAVQEDLRIKILKNKINFKKSPKERLTIPYIETRLENLEQQWSLFSATHTKIISEVRRSELCSSNYHKESVFDEVEEVYLQFKTDLKEVLLNLRQPDSDSKPCTSTEARAKTRVKLPEIKIPNFSGKYSEWQTFRDLFLGLVHENRDLDDAQRFYYLKGQLTGEAEQLLRNLETTSGGYQIAWAKLNSTYNNKRFIANGILKRLFNQRSLVSESASDIKKLISTTTDCLACMKNIGVDVSHWDIVIIYVVSTKLDRETRKAWEFHVSSGSTEDLPTFQQFSDFLTSRFRGLEQLDKEKPVVEKKTTKSFHIVKDKNGVVSCAYCAEDHNITKCKKFSKETNDVRRSFAMDKDLCFICLKGNHSAKYCKIKVRCQVCKRRHHSLLHPVNGSGSNEDETVNTVHDASSPSKGATKEECYREPTAQAEESDKQILSCLSTGNKHSQTVLLATAVVQAVARDGKHWTIRALLDQGSQGSFITEAMVQALGLKKTSVKNTLVGVGGTKSVTSTSTVTLRVRSRYEPYFECRVNAFVLRSVTSLLPVTKVTGVEWVNLGLDKLADPEYNTPNKIDALLGAEVYSQIIHEGIKKCPSASLLAQNTAFGWIISGVGDIDNSVDNHSHIVVMHTCTEADDLLKKFWELEAEPPKKTILTDEEIACEQSFVTTTKRDTEGRYVVQLPFRDADPSCKYGNSRAIALKRFHALENKLHRNEDFKTQYAAVLQEYLDLGHMKPASEADKKNAHAVYLPHHAVIRNDKDTTKLRVVFDASCKGSNGRSLNDDLLVGPTIQQDLRHLLLRWRMHPICLISDVVKMYRQVRVADKHTDFQRIVWRSNKESEIQDYKLLTVTFGTASAPFLAVRSMQQVAHDEGHKYPLARGRVLSDFYVDDLITGCQTVSEGIEIYHQMNTLLSKAGFELQKWSSNSNDLIGRIIDSRDKERSDVEMKVKIKQDEVIKTLGLTWNRSSDTFQYSIQLSPLLEPVTKRKVLADISRLFDPLGWVAPVIIIAKMLIQKLWIAGVAWDEAIPNELKMEYFTYREELQMLAGFSIPRWLGTKQSDKLIELHGFCDASKTAYAAVIYIRVIDSKGRIHISLLTSKTNVAPIKTVSIPRLELCGAMLLAKLLVEVSGVMGISKSNLYAWTDSEIVLAWLNNHPNRWKTFVANRVSEILCMTEPRQWNHVKSKQNPADFASRGLYPSKLLDSKLWLEGPDFLKETYIPLVKPKNLHTKVEEINVHLVSQDLDNWIWDKYSSLSKLVRIIAYCRRVLEWNKPKNERNKSYLKASELKLALDSCIRECQRYHFADVIGSLQGNTVKRRTTLNCLNPYLDSYNILRVGGRLALSDLSLDRKHPILIPRSSPLTNLLIADAHRLTLHGGPQLMLNYLGTKYYIVGAKRLVKSYVRACVVCLRYTSATKPQLMGQLPSARVTPSRPFKNSGVDYAGPISLRTSKGRGHHAYKGYICLFVCMATKAVHLEVVSDLTTEGFLAAFKRFVARRGHCQNLWSDNGTNFQGASSELPLLVQSEKSGIAKEIAETLANKGTTWHFIPPHAPNFGGLWEAGIKSCKQHLRKVIGTSTLTYEEMATLLSQVEACLNSRPLCKIPDSDTVEALTPGHFLVGEPITTAPDHNFEDQNISNLKRWHLVQKMTQVFWRRWSNEYLSTLLHRYKWSQQTPEPSIGDTVLIKEDNLPPCKWLLGRVVAKYPGKDNLTRVVSIRTSTSTIKRPTSKLCVLPIN